jgi:hypothetical protein
MYHKILLFINNWTIVHTMFKYRKQQFEKKMYPQRAGLEGRVDRVAA